MKYKARKLMATVLTLAMVLSLLPILALPALGATDSTTLDLSNPPAEGTNGRYQRYGNNITVTGGDPIIITGDGSVGGFSIDIADATDITIAGGTILSASNGNALFISKDATITGQGADIVINGGTDGNGLLALGNLLLEGVFGDISGDTTAVGSGGSISINGTIGNISSTKFDGIHGSKGVNISGTTGNITGFYNGISSPNGEASVSGTIGDIFGTDSYGIYGNVVTISQYATVGDITNNLGIVSETGNVSISGTIGNITSRNAGIEAVIGNIVLSNTAMIGNVSGGNAIRTPGGSITIAGSIGDVLGEGFSAIVAEYDLNITDTANIGNVTSTTLTETYPNTIGSRNGVITISGKIGNVYSENANAIATNNRNITITSTANIGDISGGNKGVGTGNGSITIAGKTGDILGGIYADKGVSITDTAIIGNISGGNAIAAPNGNITIAGKTGDIIGNGFSAIVSEYDLNITSTANIGNIAATSNGSSEPNTIGTRNGSITIAGKVGNVSSENANAIATNNSNITITDTAVLGTLTGKNYGIFAGGSGSITTKIPLTINSDSGAIMRAATVFFDGIGLTMSSPGTIGIEANVVFTADAALVTSNTSIVSITGNLTANEITGVGAGYAVRASGGSKVTIGGNVVSSVNGVFAEDSSEVTIGRQINADAGNYIILSDAGVTRAYNIDGFTEPTTKSGYRTYTDGASTVWVRNPSSGNVEEEPVTGGGTTGGTPATPPSDDSTVTADGTDVNTNNGSSTVDVSEKTGVKSVSIPNNILNQIRQNNITVALPQGNITFDPAVSGNLISDARGGGITVTIRTPELTTAQATVVGNNMVVEIVIHDYNNNEITQFQGGNATITLPYTGALPAAVWYLNAAGQLEMVDCVYDPATQTVSFSTNHLSKYVVGQIKDGIKRIRLTVGEQAYVVDSLQKTMDVAPAIVSARTMVPLRFIVEALGATVYWEDASQTATVELEGTSLDVVIGEMAPGMDVPAMIIGDRTMVPLRYLSETLGCDVEWISATQTVYINK